MYRSGLPYPFGHHSRGFCSVNCANSAGASFTSLLPGATVKSFVTVTFSIATRRVPFTGLSDTFSSGTLISTSALLVSGSGSVVTTCTSPIFTMPVAVSTTGCQMPVSRSRIAGIQSHPSVAMNVGPSSTIAPPFSPGPPRIDCSCGIPGCGGGDTRTSSTFVCPGFSTSVTSKMPRMNAPLMLPSDFPFSHTSAA